MITKYRRASFRTPEDRFLAEVFTRSDQESQELRAIDRIVTSIVLITLLALCIRLYWIGALA